VGCRSDFGVRDMHGGMWEWTRSKFGRGSTRPLVSVRGGNAPAGELVGRCANTIGRPADMRSPSIGFRCCEGPDLVPEVELSVRHPRRLEAKNALDPKLVSRLIAALPEEATNDLAGRGPIEPERSWAWWPAGNDELAIVSVCAGSGRRGSCGVLVARDLLGKASALAWAHGGTWSPLLDAENDPRDVWLLGGDDPGAFRRRMSYVWGKVTVGPRERRTILVKDRIAQERLGKNRGGTSGTAGAAKVPEKAGAKKTGKPSSGKM
jgi:hypothetical protein